MTDDPHQKRMPGGARGGVAALLLVLAVLAPMVATAESIPGPGYYVAIDVAVRDATIAGMERRYDALSAGETDPARLRAIDARTRLTVQRQYAIWGVTAAKHAAWGARNRDRIERWLVAHPKWRSAYRTLESRFQTLSTRLDQLR